MISHLSPSVVAVLILLPALSPAWGQSKAILEAQGRQHAARARELATRMEELDKDIERRVDALVNLLATVKDSPESKTRVANLKENVMEGLAASIDFYKSQRALLTDDMRRPLSAASQKDLAEDIEYMDGRTEDRVEQILKLAGSLTRHENFQKYERTWRGNRYGGVSQTVNPEYRQSKRLGSKTTAVTEEIVDALQESQDTLKQKEAALKQALDQPLAPEQAEQVKAAMDETSASMAKRQEQIAQVITSEPAPATQVGSKEAHVLEQRVRTEAESIVSDFNELVRLKSEYDLALGQLKSIQTRLRFAD